MEIKRQKTGGRVKGTPNKASGGLKNKLFLGYKYTEEEYKYMKKILEDYKKENGYTTSKSLFKMIISFDKNNTK